MYSAPSGVEYCTHSPLCACTACPGFTSMVPPLWVTRSTPCSTIEYSSNSGVCPGSSHPAGLRMCATLAPSDFVFTRPTNSSMILGFVPAASIRVGFAISVGIARLHPPEWDLPFCFALFVAATWDNHGFCPQSPGTSVSREAAVDHDRRASNEIRSVRREKYRRAGQLFRLAPASGRHAPDQ